MGKPNNNLQHCCVQLHPLLAEGHCHVQEKKHCTITNQIRTYLQQNHSSNWTEQLPVTQWAINSNH